MVVVLYLWMAPRFQYHLYEYYNLIKKTKNSYDKPSSLLFAGASSPLSSLLISILASSLTHQPQSLHNSLNRYLHAETQPAIDPTSAHNMIEGNVEPHLQLTRPSNHGTRRKWGVRGGKKHRIREDPKKMTISG